MEKKMIWSSEMLYDDEARENYLENMRAITENKDYQLTDEEWADEVYLDLSDERGNLDKKVNGIIIAFADLGLWQGRRQHPLLERPRQRQGFRSLQSDFRPQGN